MLLSYRIKCLFPPVSCHVRPRVRHIMLSKSSGAPKTKKPLHTNRLLFNNLLVFNVSWSTFSPQMKWAQVFKRHLRI